MPRDTQHEAAIEAAAKELYESMFSAADNKTWTTLDEGVRASMRDEVRRSRAAFDAARSGEAEGEAGVWATVVINDAFEPTEITDVKFLEELSETGISLERLFIRPGRSVAALAEHPEPRQDQPVARASGGAKLNQTLRPCFIASNGDTLILTDEQAANVSRILSEHPEPPDRSPGWTARKAITMRDPYDEIPEAEHPETGERGQNVRQRLRDLRDVLGRQDLPTAARYVEELEREISLLGVFKAAATQGVSDANT